MNNGRVVYIRLSLSWTKPGEMVQFCWEPEFNSHHLHGGSQPHITPVPRDPTPTSGFHGYINSHPHTHVHRILFLKLANGFALG